MLEALLESSIVGLDLEQCSTAQRHCGSRWSATAPGLITQSLVDEILDVDLHHRTPGRDREMGWRQ